MVAGYHHRLDLGGGTFVFGASSLASDDGGCTIRPDGIGPSEPGRWLRLLNDDSGYVSVRWYGARGDGVTDDTQAIQQTLDSVGSDGRVWIPDGVYLVSATLDVSGREVSGLRQYSPLLSTGSILRVASGSRLTSVVESCSSVVALDSLRIECQLSADYGLDLFQATGPGTYVRDVTVTGASLAGFRFNECEGGDFRRLSAINNGDHSDAGSSADGFLVLDGNTAVFENIVAEGNTGRGLAVFAADTSDGCLGFPTFGSSGGQYFRYGTLRFNGDTGVFSTGATTTVVFENLWLDGNAGHGFDTIGSAQIRVVNCTILGPGSGDPTYQAVRVGGNAIVIGNTIGAPAYGGTYNVVDATVATKSVVYGNYMGPPTYENVPILQANSRNTLFSRAFVFDTGPPSASNPWSEKGDVILNSIPDSGLPLGWVCTATGGPGTWAALPTIP
jgi:hypothetical protein